MEKYTELSDAIMLKAFEILHKNYKGAIIHFSNPEKVQFMRDVINDKIRTSQYFSNFSECINYLENQLKYV